MAIRIQPMTAQDLAKYFQDYRHEFPDWTVKYETTLCRSDGPIEQQISFQALRAGSYRPSCCIRVRGPGVGFQLLNRWLDVRHQQVWPREHDTKFSGVLKAMEEQFVPSIRKPLRMAEVIGLAESDTGNLQHSTGLALLNAYIGDARRALHWCHHANEQMKGLGRAPVEWEAQHAQLISDLEEAIRGGREQLFAKGVIDG
jgi:hypothetical protein